MLWLLGATIGARIHAFLAEFGMLIGAAACVVGALALLAYPIPILSRFQRILAYVLFGVAIGLVCWLGGFREGRSLSAEADLRRQVEARDALLAEKERQREAADKARLAAAMRADESEKRAVAADQKRQSYEDELAGIDRKRASRPENPCSCGFNQHDLDVFKQLRRSK